MLREQRKERDCWHGREFRGRESQREKDRDRERQREKDRDRERERQRESLKER